MNLTIKEVVALAGSRENHPYRMFPERDSTRYEDNFFYPYFNPKFKINFDVEKPVFTIGSCFARELEDSLHTLGYNIPTKHFVDLAELTAGGRLNFSLNQYNPGCMGQIIHSALSGNKLEPCVFKAKDGTYIDLLLAGAPTVPLDHLLQRHYNICDLYDGLKQAEALVLTLGITEAWYDTKSDCWLNRAPPITEYTQNSNRYRFRILDFNDCVAALETSFSMLNDLKIKTVVTVSPVPLQTTFTNSDCVVANEFGKSTLRAVAGYFTNKYSYVDYFPAYEMIRHLGMSAYRDDNIHVRLDLIDRITKAMIDVYKI